MIRGQGIDHKIERMYRVDCEEALLGNRVEAAAGSAEVPDWLRVETGGTADVKSK